MKVEMTIGGAVVAEGEGLTGLLKVMIEQLKSYRGSTPMPNELEWEIRLYKWILAQPDVDHCANLYLKARHRQSTGARIPKRQVVKNLGWVID